MKNLIVWGVDGTTDKCRALLEVLKSSDFINKNNIRALS